MNRSQFVEIIAETICDEHGYRDAYGCANCVVERLEKAGLLNFDKPTGAITEAAHSANTNVGRSADSDTTQSIGDGGADSSETAVVGQNEQVKEVCRICQSPQNVLGSDLCFQCWIRD